MVIAYERKIKELETTKALLMNKIANVGKPVSSFGDTYRTAFDFLANPSKLWHSPRLEDRRAVLKLVFLEQLPYVRGQGYRTAKISTPFKMLGGMNMCRKETVPLAGIEPALLAELDFESSASTSSATGAFASHTPSEAVVLRSGADYSGRSLPVNPVRQASSVNRIIWSRNTAV